MTRINTKADSTGKLVACALAGLALVNPVIAEAATSDGSNFFDKGKTAMTVSNEERQIIRLVNEKPVTNSVTAVAWSPDGKWIATAGGSAEVIIWDAKTLEIRHQLDQGSKGLGRNHVAFSPDSRYLASGLKTINVWDAVSGNSVRTLVAPHINLTKLQVVNIQSLSFSPDGGTLVAAYFPDKRVVIAYDVEDDKVRWSYEPIPTIGKPGLTTPVVFSPDGKYVIFGTGEGTGAFEDPKRLARIIFLDAKSGEFRRSVDDIHVADPTTLAVSPDGRQIATSTATGITSSRSNMTTNFTVTVVNKDPVRIWDMETGKLIQELPIRSQVLSLVFSRDGRYVFGAKNDINHLTLAVWDIKTSRLIQEIRANPGPMSLATSPDGKRLAAASQNRLSIYELMADR